MRKSLRITLWTLFIIYILVLLRITVFRSDFGTHRLFADGQILWVPFVSLYKILQNSFPYFLYLFVGNLIWFVPFGFLLPMLTKCGRKVILYSFLLSLAIEYCQLMFGTGVTEVEDLILNTLGGAIGYGGYLFFRHLSTRTASQKNLS